MQIAGQTDIDAPQPFVFRRTTDFQSFERQAMRRGAEVRRVDSLAEPGVGVGWDILFQFRGKDRPVKAAVTAFDRPNAFTIESVSGGLKAVSVIELVPLSPQRTRLILRTDVAADSLAGRLLLQSLKLARGQFTKRLEQRLAVFGKDTQERWTKRAE